MIETMTLGTHGRSGTAPRVSVVLPVCNGAPYVAAAVESILRQSLTAFELLAIDDGSSDGTADILAGCAARDARVRVVSRANRGLAATLNEGLTLAAAPLVAIMNADDLALPQRLACQVAFLEAHPAVAAVGGQTRCFIADREPGPATALPTTPAGVHALLATTSPLAHPAVMLRRQAALDVGGYRAELEPAEDYDLWLRLAERHELANLPDVVLHYRLHDTQATAAAFERVATATLAARELARRRAAGAAERAHGAPPSAGDWAVELGLADADIARSAIEAAVGRSESLLSVGATPTSVRGVIAALADSRAAATQPTLYEAARSWLEGRILAAGGRYAAAVPRFVEAAVAEPAFRARLAGAIGRRVNAALGTTPRADTD